MPYVKLFKTTLGLLRKYPKIYSNIYSQHNRGWSNLINFIKNGKTPNHGFFDLLYEKINIKKYTEFNSHLWVNVKFF